MHRTTIFIALALGGTAAVSCVRTSYNLNPDYCSGAQDGDSFCAQQYLDGSKPYCRSGSSACENGAEPDFDGCVVERPGDECYSPCGQGNTFADDASCLDDETTVADAGATETSSSVGETEPSSTTVEPETDTEEPSTTTGPECTEDVPCMDAAPFCVDGACSTCDATEVPDESCAMLDESLPLCVGAECVQCSTEDASACEGTTPLCDAEASTCVGCSFHEECQDLDLPACNIATGACFSADAVTPVNLSGANALQNAVNGVADGAEHTIIVTGSTASTHSAVVDGGRTIAIVSTDASIQTIRGAGGSPTLTITGADSTAYLHRVRLEDSNDLGVSVENSGVLYADNTQVVGNDGGGIELAAGTSGFLRNCMVAGAGGNPGLPAISGTGASIEVLFSTLGLDFNNGGPALECSGGSVAVRNSIIVSETSMADSEVNCPGSTIENSAQETTLSPNDWFGTGFASGDYFLTAAGQTEFANEATWEDGDPPFDFEGDARPDADGASDFAGADTVP